jgi:hypothetical protein
MLIVIKFRRVDMIRQAIIRGFMLLTMAACVMVCGQVCGAEQKSMTAEQKMQRVLDYMDIQNVMAKHSYYYGAQEQWKELDEVWSKKKDDISYGHNDGYYVGRKSVEAYYGKKNEIRRKETLEAVSKLYPEIKNTKENDGVGDLVMHAITTPYIEIAEDGQTAKGVWMSVGLCSRTGQDGKASGMWLWEKFATDFVREDGEWKIWHFQIYSDVLGTVDQAMMTMFVTQQPQGAAMAAPGVQSHDVQPQSGSGSGGGKPQVGQITGFDKNIKIHELYSATRVPNMEPVLPQPYKTWSDSFSLIK